MPAPSGHGRQDTSCARTLYSNTPIILSQAEPAEAGSRKPGLHCFQPWLPASQHPRASHARRAAAWPGRVGLGNRPAAMAGCPVSFCAEARCGSQQILQRPTEAAGDRCTSGGTAGEPGLLLPRNCTPSPSSVYIVAIFIRNVYVGVPDCVSGQSVRLQAFSAPDAVAKLAADLRAGSLVGFAGPALSGGPPPQHASCAPSSAGAAPSQPPAQTSARPPSPFAVGLYAPPPPPLGAAMPAGGVQPGPRSRSAMAMAAEVVAANAVLADRARAKQAYATADRAQVRFYRRPHTPATALHRRLSIPGPAHHPGKRFVEPLQHSCGHAQWPLTAAIGTRCSNGLCGAVGAG